MTGGGLQAPQGRFASLRRGFGLLEDWGVAVTLLAMMAIPLAEVALRATLKVGLPGSSSLVQHLVLVAGMLGGALAAREDRLLNLATGALLPEGRWKSALRAFAYGTGAAVAAGLTLASWQFVASERESGKVLVYGVPCWVVEVAMPLGFALVALRLVLLGGTSWKGRAATSALALAIILLGLFPPASPASLQWPALAALLVAAALGAPVFAVLGGAALLLFWGADVPSAAVAVEHYRLTTNPTLPAVPLFTLAGYFLAEGGASTRLVRVFHSLFGALRGGPAVVVALACAFFTSFTGGSGVTILALGGLLMPVLVGAGYPDRKAMGLITGAGALGLLFPPCFPLILYAIVAKVEVQKIFLGGILPGMLMVALTIVWGVRQAPALEKRAAFNPQEAWAACRGALWELLLPVVAVVALLGGFATPVEAAAVTALYAFVVETFVYKDLKLGRETLRVASEAGLLVGGVLLILGVALGFTNYLVDAEIPSRMVEWVTGSVTSPLLFLLLLNLFLLVVGCLMDIFSATVVVVPILVPIGAAFGIDPVHLGILFLANLELGYLTPPVGMNLFLASYRFNKPLAEVYRAVWPVLLWRVPGILLITYIPWLSTFLPRWLE